MEAPLDACEEAMIQDTDSHIKSLDAIDETLETYGMPWRSSIDSTYNGDFLFYMPFWEWQLSFMKKSLTNLKLIPSSNRAGTNDLSYAENAKKKKRMITLCFSSDEYRLIRMTLLDAGTATQVFTSLWCPRANLPVLGIDLLQFNKRHLTVVDFQPIHSCEEDHDTDYEHLLKPIRSCYPALQHKMSDRFYDETQFFSSEMLMGRGKSTEYVWSDLMPACKAYTKKHVKLAKEYQLPNNSEVMDKVLKGQKAYDDYSSVRDPAHGLLAGVFGKRYADEFVFDVLFPLSDGVPENFNEKSI